MRPDLLAKSRKSPHLDPATNNYILCRAVRQVPRGNGIFPNARLQGAFGIIDG